MIRLILLTFSIIFSFIFDSEAQVKDSTILKSIEKSNKVIIKKQRTIFDDRMDSIYQWRIQQSELDGVYIPYDLYDCFRQLDKLMEPEVRKKFMEFSDEEVDKKTHRSLGLWMDHKWKISEGSRLTSYFTKMGVPHPDYMVGIIITTYHRNLHKKEINYKELIKHFKEIWNKKQKEKAKEILQNSTIQSKSDTQKKSGGK